MHRLRLDFRTGIFILSLFLAGTQNFLCALVIDDENISVNYVAESDKGASDNIALLTNGDNQQAVQLNYNFNTTDVFTQIKKDFSLFSFSPIHFGNIKIRFYYRIAGLPNTLLFRLTDSSNVQIIKRFTNLIVNGTWQEITIPITDLTGFGSFDLYKVSQIEIALEKNSGGSGSIDIDKIELIRTSNLSAASLLLDNFDGGTGNPNQFAGPVGSFTQDTAASISTTYDNSAGNVYSGAYSLKITYNAGSKAGTDNAGYFSGPNGQDLRLYDQIEFYAKASNDNEAFKVRFGSTALSQLITIGGIGKNWQKVVIPFENYNLIWNAGANGGHGISKVTEFVIIFAPGTSAGSGNVWIDDIRFVQPAATVGLIKKIDDMDENADLSLSTWEIATDVSGSASLTTVTDGIDGRALRMYYNFNTGNYCTLVRKLLINSTLTDSVRFKYKYSGNTNNFEFHVLDSNSVQYVGKLPDISSTENLWKSITFPFNKMQRVSSSGSLDLRKLKEMRFTLLKSAGGKGTLAIDDLELVNAPKVTLGNTDQLIQSLTLDNNPFSPNEDGVKDFATFSYVLKEDSFVRLRIYDGIGTVIREFKFSQSFSAGANSIVWDGNDSNFVRARNGLYFFQFSAESTTSGQKDDVMDVIALLR